MQSIALASWIFGLAVDMEAFLGIPHDFLRLGPSYWTHISSPVTMRCKNPFRFRLWSSCSQAKKCSCFYFRKSLLAETSTHSSWCFEIFGLFSSDFLIAVASGLTVNSLCRLRGSGVDHDAGWRGVWLPSFTTTFFGNLASLILLAIISLMLLSKMSWGRSRLSMFRLRISISCSASSSPFLIGRNMFFLVLQKLFISCRIRRTFCTRPISSALHCCVRCRGKASIL